MNRVLAVAALLLAWGTLFPVSTAAEPQSRPNVVLILADDLGYGDTGCYGATKVKTPAIDRLAAEGMRFTEAYASSALCCPTRFALVSGAYPWRASRRDDTGIWATHRSPLMFSSLGPPLQHTLAALLKSAAYRTGAVGKWHLGLMNGERDWNQPLKPGPLECGFDWFFGDASNRYRFYIENHHVARLSDDRTPIEGFDDTLKIPESVWRIDYSKNAVVLNDKACEFIRTRAGEEPFFLYYAPNNIHLPLTPGAAFEGSSQPGVHGDFVQELDWTVGEVIKTLRETKELDDTLIIFSSDNGPKLSREAIAAGHRSNGVLLGQKTDVWEGGIRVPFIVRWPGRVPAGSVSRQLVSQVDVLPTLAGATGCPLPQGQHYDGRNLLDVLEAKTPDPALANRDIAANIGNRSELFAVRKGDWVYLNGQGSGGHSAGETAKNRKSKFTSFAASGFENSDVNPDGTIKEVAPAEQLYDLKTDPGQRTNVVLENPEKAQEMRKLLKPINKREVLK